MIGSDLPELNMKFGWNNMKGEKEEGYWRIMNRIFELLLQCLKSFSNQHFKASTRKEIQINSSPTPFREIIVNFMSKLKAFQGKRD